MNGRAPSAPSPSTAVGEDALSDEQRRVVEAPFGPVLVIAGAGSGKTRALTGRLARMLGGGVPPERVLLGTFTLRAARELCRRAEALAGAGARAVEAGTLHHLAYRALVRHAGPLGLPPRPRVLDRVDAEALLSAALEAEAPSLRLGARAFARLASLSLAAQRPLGAVLAERAPRLVGEGPRLEAALDGYARSKARAGALDFDDLLLWWKMLLVEHPAAGAAERARFDHLLVDEYQDTSRLQAEILDLLAGPHGSLTVVGDDAQSIYGFRGAHHGNLLDFAARHPRAQLLRLETNYRSTPEIVALANRAAARQRARADKTLRAAATASGPRPMLVQPVDLREEAEFVAARVAELAPTTALEEMAVLFRSHAQAAELELALARRRVAYHLRAGTRFFEQPHLKDVLAYLRLVDDERDPLAWARVLAIEGVGPRSTATVRRRAAQVGLAALADPSLLGALPPTARDALTRLGGRLRALAGCAPDRALALILDGGYAAHAARAFADADERLADVQALAQVAARFARPADLLAELPLAEAPDARRGHGVTLSTVHQAKGLEWDVVFVVGLTDGRFPLEAALRRDDELDEERRLFYVAVTRARRQLHLCAPRSERGAARRPSRFTVEVEPSCERWRVAAAGDAVTGDAVTGDAVTGDEG